MLRSFGLRDNCLRRNLTCSGESADPIAVPNESLWIDIFDPSAQERDAVKALFGFDPPTKEDMDEIEISSRLYQEDGGVFMTALVLSKTETAEPECEGVSFILSGERLLTVRYSEPQPFNTFANRAERQANLWPRGDIVLAGLLEAIIDRTADVLEKVGAEVDTLSKQIFGQNGQDPTRDYRKILLGLGNRNDLTSKARESLISMGRMLAFLSQAIDLKATKDMKGHIKIMTRDVQSLADHTTYLANKITFLLDAVLGVVNIEQSRIIRILSVAATVFLPPTLLASIWGMNFKHMPELEWPFGYGVALVSIVLSAVLPYILFRWRKWL
ncbi:MAG: magnesium transporter CorA family protein [Alphaproteobacteria bacterium]|nr:magnesium transporter CorA family protein [Alphaproteobacteria bacterium]